jgi:putative FmdB family regulatory protein
MPLYEYQCESCQKRFEKIQKYSDPPIETCPSCGGRVNKLLSSPAIQFKGTGWYITDYAKKSSTESSSKNTSGSSSSSSSSSGDTSNTTTNASPSTSDSSSTKKE